MQRDSLLKWAIPMFLIALAGYILLFSFDRRLREKKGPWEVSFTTNTMGECVIEIRQPSIGVNKLSLIFGGETAPTNFAPATVRFAESTPIPAPLPFGQWIYHDLMYLPGVVAMDLFPDQRDGMPVRHQVELLPRTLKINRKEYRWADGLVVRLVERDKFIKVDPKIKRR